MNIPDGLCLSTLKAIKGSGFSASARRHLWSGQKVPRVLPFSRETFQAFRGENAGRMSLSGVQEKISLRLSVGVLAPATAGGTHLLKPVPRAWAHTLELPHDVPANEHVTMQIAAQVFKMPVAACGLVFFPDGEPALIVRRFDRDPESGRPLRQEDFCQLAGLSATTAGRNFKYEGSYEQCGTILRRYCPAWRVEVRKLFRQILFNYVIGNGDAHLKNFSLLESRFGDHTLSPAYDLVCTSLHLPHETRLALDLFADEHETPFQSANGFAGRPDFLELAGRFGLPAAQAAAWLDEIPARREAMIALVGCSLLSREAKTRYQAIINDRLAALDAG